MSLVTTAEAGAGSLAGSNPSGTLERGGTRLFNAPGLSPGARLRLPSGIKAVPLEGFWEGRPRVVPRSFAWPYVRAADGSTVDASIAPTRDAPSVMAILSGFKRGWYELTPAGGGSPVLVEWNARKLPFLWYWGEWGASKELPFRGQFYTLGLEPFSRYPVR